MRRLVGLGYMQMDEAGKEGYVDSNVMIVTLIEC